MFETGDIIVSTRVDDVKQAAVQAAADEAVLKEHVETLKGSSRRDRQQAAAVIAEVARMDATLIVPFGAQLVNALSLPEAQTRWEILDALTEMCSEDTRSCDKALDGAEVALFDEDSGPLRLSAMRFLCRIGATTETRSEKVWGLIDEGIQCYHGDLEFNEMLNALVEFSSGKLAPNVKEEFAERMRFDATNGRGVLKKRASAIVSNIEG